MCFARAIHLPALTETPLQNTRSSAPTRQQKNDFAVHDCVKAPPSSFQLPHSAIIQTCFVLFLKILSIRFDSVQTSAGILKNPGLDEKF
jgi:hypothetical protein